MIRAWIHAHSRRSFDGVATAREIVQAAERHGIHLLAITDHDDPRGAEEAREEVARRGLALEVLPGWEASTDAGHLLVLGCERFIPTRRGRALCEAAKAEGATIVYAHPCQGEYRPDPAVAELVDAIEFPNLRTALADNVAALELSRELGKPVLGGLDAHSIRELERAVVCLHGGASDLLGGSTTIVERKPEPRVRAREAMRKTMRTGDPKYVTHLVARGLRRLRRR